MGRTRRNGSGGESEVARILTEGMVVGVACCHYGDVVFIKTNLPMFTLKFSTRLVLLIFEKNGFDSFQLFFQFRCVVLSRKRTPMNLQARPVL